MPYKDPAKQLEYQARWMARRRADWLTEHGPCIDCGSPDEPHVDHVDPATKISHRIWSWSPTRRDTELRKCVVRCKSCHQLKTRTQLENMTHAKITERIADEIRERYAAGGITQADLGRHHGIGSTAVSKIVRRETWH